MFVTKLRVEELDTPGYWMLCEPLIWDDGTNKIIVPAGFVTDLASIPAPMRGILNTNGPSRKPSVAHDFLYRTGVMTRKAADQLFLTMLVAQKVICIGRGLYYLGVRIGGWIPFNRYRRKEGK